MVPLDSDGELGPMRGVYGMMEVKNGVQPAIKRAELAAFLCLVRARCGSTTAHVDRKGIIKGLMEG